MRRQKWLLTSLTILVLSLSIGLSASQASSANQIDSDWTNFRHNLDRTGFTKGGGQANSVRQLWNFSTSASVWSSPAVMDGRVFVGCKDCHIYCINASNGSLLWSYPTGHEVNSSPAIANGLAYVGCDDGKLYCMNISNGEPVWIVRIGGLVRSSPLIAEGCVYIGSGSHDLFCLNATDGSTIWTSPTSQLVGSSPALSNGVVYFACDDFHVYAVNASNGQGIWRQHTGSNTNSPCLDNGYLYIGSYDGYVWALNASTGTKVWRFSTQDSVFSSVSSAYGYVYVGSADGSIYCLDASSGKPIWNYPTGYWVCSSPAISDGNLYVGSQDYNIYCLDAFTGDLKWYYPTGCIVDSSPAIVNNTLYIGSHDYHIYALSLSDSIADLVFPQSYAILPQTMLFDFLAVFVLFTVLFAAAFIIRTNKRKNSQVDSAPKSQPWYLQHLNIFCIVTIAVITTIYYLSLSDVPLWAADEKTYSQMAYHMIRSGDYLFPWSFGEQAIWSGKPPLLMWLTSLSYQVFGISNFATRFWMPILGALSLITIFYLGKKLYNPQVGFVSVIVLGTFTTFYAFATHAMTDGPLIFFILASVYFALQSIEEVGGIRYALFSGVFFGLGLMTKQIEALLIPLILMIYFAIISKSLRFMVTKRFMAFWGVALSFFLPYVVYMALRFRDFWDCYFVYSIFNRATTPIEGHLGGYFFYFNYLLTSENLFWVVLLPLAAALCIHGVFVKRSKSDTLVLVWITVVLGIFTLAQTKLYWYILPVLPAFALAISNFAFWAYHKTKRFGGNATTLLRRHRPSRTRI